MTDSIVNERLDTVGVGKPLESLRHIDHSQNHSKLLVDGIVVDGCKNLV